MTEHELRGLVRDAVARRLTEQGLATRVPSSGPAGTTPAVRGHASHLRLVLTTGKDIEGPCLIEPVTRCSHCGYCQSYGY